jgi:HAD superfamily hydrolase (TIGR01484 family)
MKHAMIPIDQFSRRAAARLRGVLTDIDDTLTSGGKLDAASYGALWRLSRAGLIVVPITGRPAGWCDLIARQWPVAGIVGENGALAFYEDAGVLQRIYHPEVSDPALHTRLDAVRHDVLAAVPGARVAKDQPFRMFDLAIDFAEEQPDLGLAAGYRIAEVFERHGAQAKVSSIHVNGWFGDYDKLSMTRLFLSRRYGIDLDRDAERFVFCGDSANDEPMFAAFPNACGVANIADFADRMRHLPRYVASRSGGAGFAELVDTLLDKREQAAQNTK